MKIKDFGLITTLVTLGCNFEDYEIDDQKRVWFKFPDTREVQAIHDAFFINAIEIKVQDFINTQTRLKTLVFRLRGDKD